VFADILIVFNGILQLNLLPVSRLNNKGTDERLRARS